MFHRLFEQAISQDVADDTVMNLASDEDVEEEKESRFIYFSFCISFSFCSMPYTRVLSYSRDNLSSVNNIFQTPIRTLMQKQMKRPLSTVRLRCGLQISRCACVVRELCRIPKDTTRT